jgi:hypothetical protein
MTPAAKRTAALFGRTGGLGGGEVTPDRYPVGVAECEIGEAFDGRVALELRYDPVGRRYASCVVVLRPAAEPDEWRFGWRAFPSAKEAIADWRQELARLSEGGLELT